MKNKVTFKEQVAKSKTKHIKYIVDVWKEIGHPLSLNQVESLNKLTLNEIYKISAQAEELLKRNTFNKKADILIHDIKEDINKLGLAKTLRIYTNKEPKKYEKEDELIFKDYEAYWKELVADGYIDDIGKPLKCQCGSKSLYNKIVNSNTYGITEEEVYCNECQSLLGCWAYGAWTDIY